MKLTVDLLQQPTIDDRLFLQDRMNESNHAVIGDCKRVPLAVFMHDEAGERQGGCIGCTYGNWLHIDLLWVAQSLRGQGAGSQLLNAMEEAGKARGCRFVILDTLSFQARPFYERHGYQLQMTLAQAPLVHERYYLTKTL
ncbi:MAG: GNAT family N-acetyltransferase [Vibrionaceae bacterium]